MKGLKNLFFVEFSEIRKSMFLFVGFSIVMPVIVYLFLFRFGDGDSQFSGMEESWWQFRFCVATFPMVILLPVFISLFYGDRYGSCEGKFLQETTGLYGLLKILFVKSLVQTLYLLVNIVIYLFVFFVLARVAFTFGAIIFVVILLYLGVVLQYVVGFMIGYLCRGNLFVRGLWVMVYLMIFFLPGVAGANDVFNYIPGVNVLLQLKSVFLFNEFNYYLLGYIFIFDVLLFLIYYAIVKKKLYR